ncbi:hypothetical protein H6G02_22315 [Leptolyngbya sp. FACHB-16]|nr:hypothetical protein [Leptolyngbya sp. FACHB-16]
MDISPRLSSERFRYQQPKRFWLGLFAGSMGLHLAALWLAPVWWRSLSPQSTGTGTEPTPIELVDASQLGGVALNDATTPADPALAGASAAGAPAATAPAAAPQPSPTVAPQPVPQPLTPQPNPVFTDTTPASPQPPADFSDVPDPSPLPQEPLPTQDPATEQPQPNQDLPSSPPETGPPVVSGNPLPSPGPVPNPSDSAEGAGLPGENDSVTSGGAEGTSDGLPDVGTPQQVSPSRGLASLTPGSALPLDATADIPEVPAQPVQTSLDFTSDPTDPNSCVITPESQVSFGEQISLRLVIDTDGRVIDAFEEGASPNPVYTDLARCLVLRNWTFTPATTSGIPQQSNLLVTLSIQAVP